MDNPDVVVGAGGPSRNRKVQFEEQQKASRAAPNFWHEVVYPGREHHRPFHASKVFEYVFTVVLAILILIIFFRQFFVEDFYQTRADIFGFWILFAFLGAVATLGVCFLAVRLIKYARDSSYSTLPNGLPISYETIRNNYIGAESVIERAGYFDVERGRAGNPIVAPGEITTTTSTSPAYTYAPSYNGGGETKDSDLLSKMMNESLNDEEDDDLQFATDLPKHADLFEYIEEREPEHILIGIGTGQQTIQMPITMMFNQLVGGQIGFGKSVYLRSLVYQLLLERKNGTLIEVHLADIENNTFPEFADCDGVSTYASNYVEIEHMTTSLLKEVERRKALYESMIGGKPKDLQRYNVLARRAGLDELSYVVVFYDEFSALMHRSQAQQKRILADIMQLSLRARKYGIALVIAGQSFKADLIDSAVIGQFAVNIAFKVRNFTQSMSIINRPGAEKLTNPGEAIMLSKDGSLAHVQTFELDDETLFDALLELKSDEKRANVPAIVQEIINFAILHEDTVKFREIEHFFREKGTSRADLQRALDWMDEHQFVVRVTKNARKLNRDYIMEIAPDTLIGKDDDADDEE